MGCSLHLTCIPKRWISLVMSKSKDLKKVSGRVSGIRSVKEFNEKLQITTSHAIEDSVPGKSLKWMVVEKKTNTILGFCRFNFPTINSRPRNQWILVRLLISTSSIDTRSWGLLSYLRIPFNL